MIRTLIFISAFFIFIYSNSEEIDKKIIGYTNSGVSIHCSDLTKNDNDVYLECINEKTRSINYKTMITFNTSLKIKDGWNIVGIAHNIENVKEFLSKDCILYAKRYINGAWQEYNALDGTNTISHINSNDAIYIYSTKECTINSYGARTFKKDEIRIQNLPFSQTAGMDINNSIDIEVEIEDDINSTKEDDGTEQPEQALSDTNTSNTDTQIQENINAIQEDTNITQ